MQRSQHRGTHTGGLQDSQQHQHDSTSSLGSDCDIPHKARSRSLSPHGGDHRGTLVISLPDGASISCQLAPNDMFKEGAIPGIVAGMTSAIKELSRGRKSSKAAEEYTRQPRKDGPSTLSEQALAQLRRHAPYLPTQHSSQ